MTLVGEREAAEADRVEWVPLAEVTKLMTAGQVPVSVCHPGHGPSFDAVRLREIADAYLAG